MSEHITSVWLANDAKLVDFEMILIHVLTAQIMGAAKDENIDPVKLEETIHYGVQKMIKKQIERHGI